MILSELLKYENIVIQCHDAPDADTVGAGFALYEYFSRNGKNVKLTYGGSYEITKPNLKKIIDKLNIPIEHMEEAPACDLLITIDCQYGNGNVSKWGAPVVAVIDHHKRSLDSEVEYSVICSNYGSCCTLVWKLLGDEGIDVNHNVRVATALYYGLYMDTSKFGEISYPLDKDMRDSLKYNKTIFFELINTNMSKEELDIFADAIRNYQLDEECHCAIVAVKQCDPNILGLISDFIIQVNEIKLCVVFCQQSNGCKFSVRSCTEEIRSDELARFLCQDIGSGGGQAQKAGGFIAEILFEDKAEESYEEYMKNRVKEHFGKYEIIRANSYNADLTSMKHYTKLRIPLGVVHLTDLVSSGTPVLIRTLEGDLECVSGSDLYIMIGIDGEVYPIREEKFFHTYEFCDREPQYISEYEPTIYNTLTGEAYLLKNYMRSCIARGTSYIYAKKLERAMKIFTSWDEHKYLKGEKGDYLAVRDEDMQDVYIIRSDIFVRSYEEENK